MVWEVGVWNVRDWSEAVNTPLMSGLDIVKGTEVAISRWLEGEINVAS